MHSKCVGHAGLLVSRASVVRVFLLATKLAIKFGPPLNYSYFFRSLRHLCYLCARNTGRRSLLAVRQRPTIKMHFTGLIIAACAFIIIGVFHPIVIKTEYYSGTRFWWVFLVLGLACVVAALLVANTVGSALLGILGASLLWSIHELFEQKERVKKGWFPKRDARRPQPQHPDEE